MKKRLYCSPELEEIELVFESRLLEGSPATGGNEDIIPGADD